MPVADAAGLDPLAAPVVGAEEAVPAGAVPVAGRVPLLTGKGAGATVGMAGAGAGIVARVVGATSGAAGAGAEMAGAEAAGAAGATSGAAGADGATSGAAAGADGATSGAAAGADGATSGAAGAAGATGATEAAGAGAAGAAGAEGAMGAAVGATGAGLGATALTAGAVEVGMLVLIFLVCLCRRGRTGKSMPSWHGIRGSSKRGRRRGSWRLTADFAVTTCRLEADGQIMYFSCTHSSSACAQHVEYVLRTLHEMVIIAYLPVARPCSSKKGSTKGRLIHSTE